MYSPSPDGRRRGSSISPVISSFVLFPETALQFPRNEARTLRKPSPNVSLPNPLIHKRRPASVETSILRRSSSARRATRKVPRSVSFDAPALRRLSTTTECDVKVSTITPSVRKIDRSKECRVFLASMMAVTITITMIEPLALFYYASPCSLPRCYRPSFAIRESIKPSVAPCHDFFRYSCSGANSPRFTKLYDSLMYSVLRSIAATPARPGQSSVQKAGIVLRNCLRLTHQKPDYIDKIKGVLYIGGFTFPEMTPTSVLFIVRGIVDINLHLGIAPLFRLTVGHNLRLRRGYMLYLAPSYHIYPFVKFLFQLQKVRKLEEYVRRSAEIIGEHGMSYMRVIQAVLTVNRQFYRLPEVEPPDAQIRYSTEYPTTEFWFSMSEVIARKLRSLPNVRSTFLVLDSEYAEYLTRNVFMALDPTLISAYIGMYIVWFLSPLASHSIAYDTPMPNNTNRLKDLWPRCFSDIHELMPFAVERLYLNDHVDRTDTEHIVDMAERIKNSTANFITSLHKPSQESEVRMMNKIATLRILPYTFGALHDVAEVDRLYMHVPDQEDGTYLDSYLSLCRVTTQYMVSLLLDSTANTSKFFVPPFRKSLPHMVSVYNTIHLGLDTIVPPLDKSFSLNYAIVGRRVVQQVSKLFFNAPNIFNETGSYDTVWSYDFVNALRKKYQCLRRQHLDDGFSTGEIKRRFLEAAVITEILFSAYKDVRKVPKHAAHFRQEKEEFRMTSEQLFFVGLCINWYQQNHGYRSLTDRVCRYSLLSLSGFKDAFACPRTAPAYTVQDECADMLPTAASGTSTINTTIIAATITMATTETEAATAVVASPPHPPQ